MFRFVKLFIPWKINLIHEKSSCRVMADTHRSFFFVSKTKISKPSHVTCIKSIDIFYRMYLVLYRHLIWWTSLYGLCIFFCLFSTFIHSFWRCFISTTKEAPKPIKNNRKKSGNGIKCVVVGDETVGKTNLILAYLQHRFTTQHVPTASDIYNCK